MNENKSNNSWFIPVLALIFIVLKLTGEIDWSWLWVLSPIWIPLVLSLIVIIFAFFKGIHKEIKKQEKEKKWMDKAENDILLHQMWTGERDEE